MQGDRSAAGHVAELSEQLRCLGCRHLGVRRAFPTWFSGYLLAESAPLR